MLKLSGSEILITLILHFDIYIFHLKRGLSAKHNFIGKAAGICFSLVGNLRGFWRNL